MNNENNNFQIDIDNLFKQNVNDLSAIKELYRKLQDMENKILQIKYIDSNLANKLKKEYESLKRIILDENIQAELKNKIEDTKTEIKSTKAKINEINSQLDTIESQKLDKDGIVTMVNMGQDVKKAMVGGAVPYVGENSVNEITFNQDLKKSLCSYKKVKLEVLDGYFDSYTNYNTIGTSKNYKSIKKSCLEGERYSCDCAIDTPSLSKVIFYNEKGSILSSIGKGENGTYENFEFTVPEGAVSLSITTKISLLSEPVLRKLTINDTNEVIDNIGYLTNDLYKLKSKYPIYAFVNWNVYYFMWKYDNTRDIIISLNKVGKSSLYQLSHFYTVPNEDKECSGDFTLTQSQLKATSSDFVGPYKVLAKNNIDGDNTSEEKIRFTGGWHGYNGDQTGGATGRNISINVFVDGKKMSSTNKTKIGGRKIDVVVVNEINASNTTKSDGTGRNVLQETVTYTFTEGKIDVDVKIKALEDITIKEYYGLQVEASGYKQNVTFISDDSIVTDYTKYSYAGTKQEQICNTIISNGTDKCIIANIDDSYGLGRRKYVSDTSYTAWSADYGKSYFYLVKDKDLELKENQCAFWRGSYKIINRVV